MYDEERLPVKKPLGLAMVVAAGIVVGLWWTTDDAASPIVADRSSQSQARRVRPDVTPALAARVRRSLEPTDTDPKHRELQNALWKDLRRWAGKARLTDAQWNRFQRDLSELAVLESAALANGVRVGFDGVRELQEELDRELEAHCAEYMTDKQLRAMRPYLSALVTRVRQLHYSPVVLPDR